MLWHKDARLPDGLDGIGVPGGFSYGDYLRGGAMARFSPVMPRLRGAAPGGPDRCSASATASRSCASRACCPGALVRNRDLRFICATTCAWSATTYAISFEADRKGQTLQLPIKHGEGSLRAGSERGRPRVAFRYLARENPNGTTDINGSPGDGAANRQGNVLGLMPHPEHAVDPLLGGSDRRRPCSTPSSAACAGGDA